MLCMHTQLLASAEMPPRDGFFYHSQLTLERISIRFLSGFVHADVFCMHCHSEGSSVTWSGSMLVIMLLCAMMPEGHCHLLMHLSCLIFHSMISHLFPPGVHDSFWTHAGSVDEMGKILREAFYNLHSQPLLENVSLTLQVSHVVLLHMCSVFFNCFKYLCLVPHDCTHSQCIDVRMHDSATPLHLPSFVCHSFWRNFSNDIHP